MEEEDKLKVRQEALEFALRLLEKIEDTKSETKGFDDIEINLEHHLAKDYWTIDFMFRYCNSEYRDCVVFYLNDSFDEEEIDSDFDLIVNKAGRILG